MSFDRVPAVRRPSCFINSGSTWATIAAPNSSWHAQRIGNRPVEPASPGDFPSARISISLTMIRTRPAILDGAIQDQIASNAAQAPRRVATGRSTRRKAPGTQEIHRKRDSPAEIPQPAQGQTVILVGTNRTQGCHTQAQTPFRSRRRGRVGRSTHNAIT